MPRGDRTGPMGMGPMTGRAAGYCAGYGVPGYMNPGFGPWCTGGYGRGWRHWYHATGLPGWARFGWAPAWGTVPPAWQPPKEQEAQWLRQQADWLKQQLEAIQRRLDELEKED